MFGHTTGVWPSKVADKRGTLAASYRTDLMSPQSTSPKNSLKKVSTAGSVQVSNGDRISLRKGKPSLMSENIGPSSLVATRIPYRNSQLDHTMTKSFGEGDKKLKEFNV